MRASHLAPSAAVLALLAAAVASPACRTAPPGPEADLVVVGIDQRLRLGDRLPATSPVFDGQVVRARAARGETLALVVWYRGRRDVSLAAAPPGLHLQLAQLGAVEVTRGSTTMYGGGRGRGAYPDVVGPPLQPSPPGAGANLTALSGPLLLELEVEPGAAPGPARLAITIGDRVVPIELTVAATVVPGSAPTAWGYYDRRELRAHGVDADGERACVGMFARHGVMASPEMTEASWAEDGAALRAAGFPYVPVLLPRDPDQLERAVAWWVQATAGTGQVPFAIPIDEPKGAVAWAEVRTLADRVRAAGGGPGRFLYAVTDRPRAEYGDRVDLYISPFVPTLAGPAVPPGAAVWTYNGTPPWAGSMVVDAGGADLRTWGWIGWRYQIPVWYVWDVLYWHDRHNRRRRGEDPLGVIREKHDRIDLPCEKNKFHAGPSFALDFIEMATDGGAVAAGRYVGGHWSFTQTALGLWPELAQAWIAPGPEGPTYAESWSIAALAFILSLAFWLPWMLWWTSIGAREARHTTAGSAPS